MVQKSKKTSGKKVKRTPKKVVKKVASGVKKVAVSGAKTVATTTKKVKKQINIPNILTIGRIWVIPLVVLALYFKDNIWMSWLSVLLFALAGVTDFFDGYLARHLNQGSSFGRVLDPIADKLLVGAVIVMLAYTGRLNEGYCFIPAVIIMCREILVSGLREYLAEIKVGCPVTRLAKWKTTIQMLALPIMMVAHHHLHLIGFEHFDLILYAGIFFMWVAAILTIITGYDYWKSGRKYMN
ncbi:MAG: CDP-diacylglycerol--glycerol-3-phosphate 3-phosphatidyltransferase [Alphaproteobacteria bacterium]|nr:CDP-diacylglycerol--glycerol-3-phosphate 3-phosphatidyltransferase [Alphaproteobacteria bacterium]